MNEATKKLYQQANASLTAYNYVTHNVGKTEGWILSKFHVYLCERVQEFIERPSNKPYEILIISTPPQHGKSVTITETLPSWYLGRHPERMVIELSYNSDFAQRFGKRNKEKIEEFGEDIFGIKLSKETKSASEWELTTGGGMTSVGKDGSIMGRKGNLIIVDDPIKSAAEAKSDNYRESLWDIWEHSIKTRTHPGTKVIVIMTRWHEDDLVGRLLKSEECEYINLPAECDSEDDPLKRNIGDPLCPEIGKDKAWLDEFKKSYTEGEGIGAWYALFQGQPVTEGGNILKEDWWQYYETDDVKSFVQSMDEILMSVDAAFKDTGDPVCIQIWGRAKANLYLIDMINDRLDFQKTVKAIQGMKLTYPTTKQILIEDKANGSAVISTLRVEIPGIIPIEPLGGKVSRVQAVTWVIESKNVFLPKRKNFTKEFVAQCSAFPNGKHDDMVDAMSQALTRLSKHKTHEQQLRQKTIMDFFSKPKQKRKSYGGKGEKINVI